MRRKHAALITSFLLVCLCVSAGLWLKAQQRQYALNGQLIDALVKGNDKRALALVNVGADPNTRYAPTPIPSLLQLVKQLLHRSPSPVNDSETALSMACGGKWDGEDATDEAQQHRPDDAPLVQAMLTHGANVNVRTVRGSTPLMWAALWHRRKTARLLLDRGANVNAQDQGGATPLICATMDSGAPPDLVRLLLDHGATVNSQDMTGNRALSYALWADDKDIVGLLLAHGANPNFSNKDGDTPLKLAPAMKYPEIVALLKHYGARK